MSLKNKELRLTNTTPNLFATASFNQGAQFYHAGSQIVAAFEDEDSVSIVIHVVWETRQEEQQTATTQDSNLSGLATVYECPILRAVEQETIEGTFHGKPLTVKLVFVYI